MKKFHAKRLLKLAEKLESVPAKKFDMTTWKTETYKGERLCGTAACALGWACEIPEFRKAGLRAKLDYTDESEEGKLQLDYRVTCPSKNAIGGVAENRFAGEEFFGLTPGEAYTLFMPETYFGTVAGNITRRMVAKRIHELVRKYHPDLLETTK